MDIQHTAALSPNSLHLEVFEEDSILADKVEVQLMVMSSSSVRSSEASRAVAEIAEFLGEAAKIGITEEQVEIHGASVAEGKGIFGRGSTASFELVVRDVPTDQLVGLLQVATRLPSTRHRSTRWCFDVPEEFKVDLFRRVSAKARRRADAAAESLGVQVEGVLSCELSIGDELGSHMMHGGSPSAAPMMMKKSTSMSSLEEQAGIELVKRIELRASAQVVFRLSA